MSALMGVHLALDRRQGIGGSSALMCPFQGIGWEEIDAIERARCANEMA
jgi:hypothetical protein